MAAGVTHHSILMRFSEDHLQCSICQDLLKKPKTLPCLHSFCEECLLACQQSHKRNVVCPLCRTEIKGGIRKLATDFKLASMVDRVVQESKQTVPTCSSHAGKKCVVFCETCSDLICLTCLSDSELHRKHEVGEVTHETEVAAKRQFVKANNPKYQEYLTENEEALATVAALKADLRVALQQSRKDVEAKADEEIAKVTAAKQRILGEISQMQAIQEKVLNDYTADLSCRNKTLEQMIRHSRHAVDTYNDYEFLQRYSKLTSGLRILAEHPAPRVDTNVSALEFQPSGTTENINLGSLRTVRSCEWELCAETNLSESYGGRSVTALPDGTLLVADPWMRRIVKVRVGKSLEVFKTMKTRPRDISTTNHHLVVVDNTNFVKMFKLGKGKEDFKFSTVPSCEVRKTLVDLRSVAVKGSGSIVVGDVKRSVMTEHCPTNGALLRFIQLETPPEFLALNSQSQALVSGEYTGKVDGVTDDHSDTSFTITPTIRLATQKPSTSKVRCCTGVCWGKNGSVYVAVHNKATGSGHVHVYDATGRFISCIIQGLYLPQGVRLTQDDTRMVVTDYYTIKFYRIRE